MTIIYHIVPASDWQAAQVQGRYEAPRLATEGYIHCSTRAQVVGVANARFRGVRGLLLLAIDESSVRSEIRYENLEGGETLFPHIYGPLETDAVSATYDFPPAVDGSFTLPGEMA